MTPPKRPQSERGRSPREEDLLDGDIPDDEAPPTAAELAHAASFAALLDRAEQGRIPPALATDARALLEMATVIRAAAGRVELAAEPRRQLVEEVLTSALEPREAGLGVRRLSALMRSATSATSTPAGGHARPVRRWVPWTLAATTALAAAAALTLWLRPPRTILVPQISSGVPSAWTSRPADAVVGEITRQTAGEAARRIDSIYSDRLEGYRAATLFRQGDAP